MPAIYDNIDKNILAGLKDALCPSRRAERADICVGYFNLRGWRGIAKSIDALSGQGDLPPCRLIVGMSVAADYAVRQHYNQSNEEPSNKVVVARKKHFAESLAKQLTYGMPTRADEVGLSKLAKQLRNKQLTVKFFGGYSLHAKLYLAHRQDKITPIVGFVGSSNLTLAGMEKQGELNVDVTDQDTAEKLADWFEDRWNDRYCLDITEDLADIIEQSWAGGPLKPYEIYIKTAYELSREAIEGAEGFTLPREFNEIMLDFQKQAVSLVAERLNHHSGVIIGDVVGLGKTLVASAVARLFQDDHGGNVLVICPPKLKEMWNGYLHNYSIAGTTLSLGSAHNLPDLPRYRLVIVDESHNLRNRDASRYSYVHDYIRENDSHVLLLTATPYNKQFTDIGNQLRLFLEPTADLGIRPEGYLNSLSDTSGFKHRHPNTLAAFERSEETDDWRELMRMFMVRRTRSHIKKNYAEYDEERKQHYLTFSNGERFYFPHRRPKRAEFTLDANNSSDQYALLYSKKVVDIINKLNLPRYGAANYLLPKYQQPPAELGETAIKTIQNLNRSGKQLLGFARSQLFKRLESSGPAFIISLQRHITRNAICLAALKEGEPFPSGKHFGSLADETDDDGEGEDNDLIKPGRRTPKVLVDFLVSGEGLYVKLLADKNFCARVTWLKSGWFNDSLAKDLRADCRTLLKILKIVPEWNANSDRKLSALAELCLETHKTDKLLVFTQFKDTADYLFRQLKKRGVSEIAEVHGNMDDISSRVKRFSPTSNNSPASVENPLRVLITTDTLSEGQNLQDAHIVVNFDLPWALIRLVQRAGRVDRIGQKSSEILCYCFLPEEGIDNIINLRERLQTRIGESAELLGSDEAFFEGNRINLEQVYDETIDLEEEEGETDLISRAYDIWRQAIKDNPDLEQRIKDLPDVVYSAKEMDEEQGVIAYIKTNNNQHILAQLNDAGEVISQAQSKILDVLECEPQTPVKQPAEDHHELVARAVRLIKEGQMQTGGQLGGRNSTRRRLYSRLTEYLTEQKETLFATESLKLATQQVYHNPLQEVASDQIKRQLNTKMTQDDLAKMVEDLYNEGKLCILHKSGEAIEPRIICSMGLVASKVSSENPPPDDDERPSNGLRA